MNSPELIHFIVAIIVLFLIFKFIRWFSIDSYHNQSVNNNNKQYIKNESPYIKKQFFFSQNERKFFIKLYQLLYENFDNQYILFSKVRLADIIEVNKNIKNITHWNKIKSKHVDYVVCDKKDYKIHLAIELNDSTHYTIDRNERDQFVNLSLSAAWLKIVFFNYNQLSDEYVLSVLIQNLV